jgi:hypothetical protein
MYEGSYDLDLISGDRLGAMEVHHNFYQLVSMNGLMICLILMAANDDILEPMIMRIKISIIRY